MPARNLEPQNQNATEDSTSNTELPQPVRELTQTDKLNKRLLLSFLERINESGTPAIETTPEDANAENEFA